MVFHFPLQILLWFLALRLFMQELIPLCHEMILFAIDTNFKAFWQTTETCIIRIINWSKTGVWPISMSVDAMVISFRDMLGNIIGSFSRHIFLLITAKFATGRWTALVFFFTATLIPVRFTMSGWLFGPSRYTYIMRKIHRFHIVHWNSLPWTQTTLSPYEIY